MNSGKIDTFNYRFIYNRGFNQFYRCNETATGIYIIVPETGNKTLLFDIINMVYKEPDGEIREQISDEFFLSKNKVLIELCYFGENPGCLDNKFFLIDNKKITDITKKIKPECNKNIFQGFTSKIIHISKDQKYIMEQAELQKIPKDSIRNRIFDTEMNLISDVLVRKTSNCGINMQNYIIQNYFIKSSTDNNSV